MTDSVLSVRDLRKEFIVSHSGVASIKTLLLWWRERRKLQHLNVLRGVSFDIRRGETVGIVGRNGAGKSTLLSLIARVYKPTSGEIVVNGRIAPLLELGAGFHPELTGIENVYFNAVILGLTPAQIEERIDQIIEFSEIHEHMDAPVRTYSSGMVARLGFAVAVHVDADLLLVDEVLAVGDFDFQQKCFRKINDFKSKGGSIMFVSHSPGLVSEIADRCIWLQHGMIEKQGNPREVMEAYVKGAGDPL